MRWLLVLMCMIAVGTLLGGCRSQKEIVSDSPSATASKKIETELQVVTSTTEEDESFVFRAKYYETTGPCIQLGDDAVGMPIIDAFEVVESLRGELKAKSICVLAMTEGGSAYPKEMIEGKIYTLLLKPSESTTIQLRENRREGQMILWINGNEIEEQKPGN